MWPYPWTHVGTPSHPGHMNRLAATMLSQAHAGAASEAPDIGQWEGQDVPLVKPSSCIVKGGIPSSRRYLPTYLRSTARVAEHVCDPEYLFSRMNVGSYGPTEPHLWLMSKIPTRTWHDCRTTSERKSRTHTYDDPVDLLIQQALERENDSHMEKFLKRHLGRGASPTPECGERKRA